MVNSRYDPLEIEDFFKSFGIGVKKDPVQEARVALRKYASQETDKVYARTLKAVGKDLQFGSPKHLITGLFDLVNDSFYTLWNPITKIVSSPIFKEVIAEEFGPEKTLADVLTEEFLEEKLGMQTDKPTIESIKNSLDDLRLFNKYAENLADYSREHERKPASVLKSDTDRLAIIEKTYGSLEDYIRRKEETLSSISQARNKMKILELLPLNIILPSMISKKFELDLNQLQKAGIDLGEISGIVQDYLNDATKFASEFLNQTLLYNQQEIANYRKIKGMGNELK
jgi:hypothetical protein